MKNNRDDSIDFIKGILAILVVLGHCMSFGFSDSAFKLIEVEKLFLFRLIYSFHMPLFMIISGYFTSLILNTHTIRRVVKKRLTQLIVPLMVIALLKFSIVFILTKRINMEILYKEFFINFWFGWAVFYFTLMVFLVEKVLKHKILYIIIFLLSFTVSGFPNIVVFRFELLFFLFGLYFSNWIDYFNDKISILNNPIIFMLCICLIIFTTIYSSKMPIHITPVFENFNIGSLLFDMIRWFIGIINSILVYIITKYMYFRVSRRFTSFIVELGINSYFIYIIHSYVVQGIVKRIAIFYNIEFSYSILVIELIFVLIFTYVLLRIFKYSFLKGKCSLLMLKSKIIK